ncbi:Transmembrane protease serine 6, partial [Orchesella cincta]
WQKGKRCRRRPKSEGEDEGQSGETFNEYIIDARQLTKELDLMEGDFLGRSDDTRKNSKVFLPPDVLEYKSRINNCKKEYMMNSPEKVCKYEFVGTKTDNCTVAFMCKGRVHFKPPDKEKGCDEDFIKISDGSNGRLAGCGHFIFDDRPRVARNGGTDIYFKFQGKSDDAICVVFCKQDAKSDYPKMRKLCGKKDVPQGRIVGGDTAEKFEFPWIAALLYKAQRRFRLSFCGASLINDRYAITAAHCLGKDITADKIQLIFHAHVLDRKVGGDFNANDKIFQHIPGWNDRRETDESEQSVRVDVERVLLHPKYVANTFDYDIALMKLKNKLNLKKDKVTPICLPEVSDAFNYTGKNLTVAGWGRYSETLHANVRLLQKLDVPFHSLQECRKYNNAQSRHICAGYLRGEKDACSGDSGGPLIYKNDPIKNQHVLAGIVSAGRGCARANALGLYTNVEGKPIFISSRIYYSNFVT